jgi:hypothetical protein
LDLSKSFPDVSSRLTLCVTALGQLPSEKRSEVVANIWKHLEKGGALILVEELGDEMDCSSWLETLTEAGFSSVTRIWSFGRVCAWVAKK